MQIPKGKAVLTREFLINTPKNLRQQEIFYHICGYQRGNGIKEEFDKISRMIKGYQMIWTLWHLQGEVNNGGHFQYFDNFEANNQVKEPYYKLTNEFIVMIGCTKLSKNFLKSLEIYNRCRECEDDVESDKIGEEMNEVDNMFYENESVFIQAIDDYIEANLNEFVTKE